MEALHTRPTMHAPSITHILIVMLLVLVSSMAPQGLTLEGVRRKLKDFHDAIGGEVGKEDAKRQSACEMRDSWFLLVASAWQDSFSAGRFNAQGLTLEGVRRKLKEFHDALGEEGGEEDAERQRAKVMRLLGALGYEEPEEAPPEPPANGTADAGTLTSSLATCSMQPDSACPPRSVCGCTVCDGCRVLQKSPQNAHQSL